MAEYRPYLMRLSSRSLVEPNFIRLILTGDEVRFPQPCLDRRIKLLFIGEHPNPALTDPKVGDGWYQLWLDDPARPEMRTYTVRRVIENGIVIDVACHDGDGPGHRFATSAPLGSQVLVIGLDATAPGAEQTGIDFHPGDAKRLLILGDDAAAPAVCSILEQLPTHAAEVEAVVEVPQLARKIEAGPDGHWTDSRGNRINIRWQERLGERGDRLAEAIEDHLHRFPFPAANRTLLRRDPTICCGTPLLARRKSFTRGLPASPQWCAACDGSSSTITASIVVTSPSWAIGDTAARGCECAGSAR